jgi:hypothetical protein
MNLNNKNLAIGLSIAAVVVVSYQVFFNKPTKPVRRPTQSTPMFSTTGRPAAANTPAKSGPNKIEPAESGGAGSSKSPEAANQGLVIDYNSEILLKRVEADFTEPYPKMELQQQFGSDIFIKTEEPVILKKPPPKPTLEREVEFKLNAIIIDETRRIAIINNTILKVGDVFLGAEVKSIKKRRVVLIIEGNRILLSTNSRIKKVRLSGGHGEK